MGMFYTCSILMLLILMLIIIYSESFFFINKTIIFVMQLNDHF